MFKEISIIEKELSAVLNMHQQSAETHAKYRLRLLKGAHNLPKSEWESRLSYPTKAWHRKAVLALNEGGKIVSQFPDDKFRRKKIAKGNKLSVKHAKENTSRHYGGASMRLRELLLEHGINTIPSKLLPILESEGLVLGRHAAKIVAREFRASIFCLREEGYLSHNPND